MPISQGIEAAAGMKAARPNKRKNMIINHAEILDGIFILHSPLTEFDRPNWTALLP